MLGPKIKKLPDNHCSEPECLIQLSLLVSSVGNHIESKRLLTYALRLWRESRRIVRIRSHDSNTTRNSGEFPRYVYLLVIRFPETPDFLMFSISGKLRNSDVSDFRKLRTPTFSEIFVLCNHSCFMSSPFTGDSVCSR